MTPFPRFWTKVLVVTDGCWMWQGARSRSGKGYGQFFLNGKNRPAHRVAYELEVGAIPEGLQVLHRCDQMGCVRPDHLFLGTQSDNMQDCADKGRINRDNPRGDAHWSKRLVHRRPRGERHGSAKLTDVQVADIRARAAAGASKASLAREYGLSDSYVGSLIRGKYRALTALSEQA